MGLELNFQHFVYIGVSGRYIYIYMHIGRASYHS